MAFTDRTFGGEWINHLWLIEVQSHNIADFGFPSYFLHSDTLGAYYPLYAFYGGTLYAVSGGLALAVGAVSSIVLVYLAAFFSAYAGWTWLSFQAGLRGWPAFLPGCIAVTAPYAITVAYGRGDFSETVATSMIPLVAASGLAIIRADRLRAGTVAVFLVAVALLTGSHTLTLVWGTSFLIVTGLLGALCWRQELRRRARRLGQLAALAVLGLAINAWYLVPLAFYSHMTMIGEHPAALTQTSFTVVGELFSPLRSTPAHTAVATAGGIQAQLPVLALLCAVLFGALAWGDTPRERRLFAAALGLGLASVLLLLLSPSLIEHLPHLWRFIQFPYRLVTYADLLVVALLVLALAGLRARRREFHIAVGVVAVVAAIGTVQALAQFLGSPFGPEAATFTPIKRETAFSSLIEPPPSWIAGREFGDVSQPVVQPTLLRPLTIPVAQSHQLRYVVEYPPGPGGEVTTNITAGPKFVQTEGATIAGRTAAEQMVLRLPASESPRRVKVSPRNSAPLVIGQAISVVALLAAIGLVAALAARPKRTRNQPSRASRSAA